MAEQAGSGFWSMQATYASNKNNKLVFVFHRAVAPIVMTTCQIFNRFNTDYESLSSRLSITIPFT
ncbi:hypothetical protein T10_13280 [Trichinella papuae]|uniref:Uncharacterized protein n=1 Tax=Trichinella papuae TaxID=268474 RepID=A0A0V1N746_9BILA|nr:hypothetical protein T10_13280 [Trichinella papuae]